MESSIMKTSRLSLAACLLCAALLASGAVHAKKDRTTGRGTGPVIYVTSQGLYYDSIVVVESLPAKGRFQELVADMNGLSTEFGPGAPGHLGGRWWMDLNGNRMQDSEDHYFLCPLLGPGRDHM
jgi:hypothetical protein